MPSQQKVVLVIGAAGFLGFSISRAFSLQGYRVYGLLRSEVVADKLRAEEVCDSFTFTSPLHHLHITFTSPLHHLHITFTSPSHHLRITCAPPSPSHTHHLFITSLTFTSSSHHLFAFFTSPPSFLKNTHFPLLLPPPLLQPRADHPCDWVC
jgi:hypothetical protein